jgi:ABC-type lipoprotein export system ATPase subunit
MASVKIPLIYVIESRRNRLGNYPQEAFFYLEKDSWNDFGFLTTYHLHVSGELTEDGQAALIGFLRILRKDQTDRDPSQLKQGPLNRLGEDFCSMSNSLDYYERISQLPQRYRDRILLALRDLIIYPEIKEEFKREVGFKKSLMRSTNLDDELFDLAPLLISRDFHKLLELDLTFNFSIPEMAKPMVFNFDSPKYGWNEKSLPNRMIAIIGRNGSGKSTLLSRISRIAYASATNRRDRYLKQVGSISPQGLGFPRVIFLSYSAFDAFNTPGIFKSEKESIILEMKNGLGRYVFCGIRDIVAEFEETVPHLDTDDNGKLGRRDILADRIENTKLKSIAQLAAEFVRTMRIIQEIDGAQELLLEAMNKLSDEKSMHDLLPEDDLNDLSDKALDRFFRQLSTGHKFVLHAVTNIVAYAAPRSILLFDEPETHLHPPILAALMKTIRFVLKKRNAFMIVATHSPVVLQETLQQHVYVIRREGDLMAADQPDIETFGENVGILAQLAFGLTSDITDYHDTLDRLVKAYTDDFFGADEPEKQLELIEQHFPDGLSMQARSYILSKLYKKN